MFPTTLWSILSPFYAWENWGPRSLFVSGRVKICMQLSLMYKFFLPHDLVSRKPHKWHKISSPPQSSSSQVLRGKLSMTWSFYIAESVAFISLCSAALKAHNFLTGSAHGKLYLVRKKRSANESLLKLESHRVDLPGVILVAWTQLVVLMKSVSFPLEGHDWSSCLCSQGITRSLEPCGSSRSPPYLPWIDPCLWTLDPQSYPGENPCLFIPYSLPEVSGTSGGCLS